MIKLYQYTTCLFCAKVRAKLAELNLDYQAIEVDFLNKPEIVQKANNGLVPVLVDGEKVVVESAAIVAYLQEKYGKKTSPKS
jgi:glutathione S-transferase